MQENRNKRMKEGCRRCSLVLLMQFLLLAFCLPSHAVVYTKQDSITVEKLLREGKTQPKGTCLPLFYAYKLKGLPYVKSTLEFNPKEELAINLTQMDCATLVDNVLALSFTTQKGSTSFKQFCYWLERIRYRNGKLDGYASRNHYFSQWVISNRKMGLIKELQGDAAHQYSPFTAEKKIDLHYMTSHPSSYPMLRRDPSQKSLIAQYEKEASGQTLRYVPREMLDKGKDVLGCIHDGDILALVTKKDGLDVSHLGLAVWGKDGKLHLLNASSIHHKVVLEPMTLYEYMGHHPSQLGVRVIRMTINN